MLHKVENRWKNKKIFYEDVSREWTTHHTSELIIGMGDFNGHIGKTLMDLIGSMEDLILAKEIKKEGCC